MTPEMVSASGEHNLSPFLQTHSSTPMKLNALALSSLLVAAPVLSFAAPAANAQNFTPDAGGIHGLCDSSSRYRHTRTFWGRRTRIGGSRRNCQAARDWASREAERNRNHDRNSQFIGIGGDLLTGLILNSQQRQAQPAPSTSMKAEMALMKQQQEIELLKMQLQAQQAAQYGAPVHVQHSVPVRPAYTPYAY